MLNEPAPAPDNQPILNEIEANKAIRCALDEQLQIIRCLPSSRERSLAITKTQEAIMWLGMDLKRIKDTTGVGADPYPESYNPKSPRIEPTADGLRM